MKRRSGVRWRRLLPLLAAVVALVVVMLVVVGTCGGENGEAERAEPVGDDDAPAVASGEVAATIGEEADLAGVGVLTSAIVETTRPALPDSTVAGGAVGPGSGTYYQVRLFVRNASPTPVRLDPSEFTLEADGETLYMDPRRSGPSSRTLLPSATLDVILTFPGPPGLDPTLIYHPGWFPGTLTVKAEADAALQPAGLASA